jgi:hypothetical protein
MCARFALALAILVGALATAAEAHDYPATAKKLNAFLVQNYPECAAPDTTTLGGAQACLEASPVDTLCTFPGAGSGKVSIGVSGESLKAKVKIQGLAPTCDGQTLSLKLGVRTTTDDCAGGHCTAVDEALSIGTCTVTAGKCSFSAVVASGYPAGAGSGLQILSCSVGRAGFDSFACGLLIP